MGSVLTALDAAVERFGRGAITDPVALAAALRAVTDPPAEVAVDALVRAAGSGAVERMHEVLSRDAEPEDALAEAVVVAAPDVDPAAASPARWACTQLGAALGLLPREWARTDSPPPAPGPDVERTDATRDIGERARAVLGGASVTADRTAETAPPDGTGGDPGTRTADIDPAAPLVTGRRSGIGVVALLVVLVLAAGGVLYVAFAPSGGPRPAMAVATPDPPPPPPQSAAPSAPGTTTPAPPAGEKDSSLLDGAPADPRDAFVDPGLLALAEPYLSGPGAVCVGEEPAVNQQESVTCDLGNGYAALFSRMLTVDLLHDLRGSFVEGPYAVPGTVRSLRWKYRADPPGTKTGIPADSPERGEGVRVRYIDANGMVPRLYFDQDSTASSGFIVAVDPDADLDDLRSFWAAPTR
ncbi:hypothetical protein [Pseudonocardia lacus]|uniref:hypothetical protein n=1 Tax=Pseudonocardia lacus TaxID=2835865 RepID=UPI001BDCF39E|nr:hypothetical protein [Pseudonocardia lacus]